MQTTPEFDRRVQTLLTEFSEYRKSLTPTLLQLAVQEFGALRDEVLDWIAGLTGVGKEEVLAIAKYLDLLQPESRARNRVLVCIHIHCANAGSETYLKQMEDALGIREGGKTRDGKYELLKVQCLGCCEQAPVIQLNRQYFLQVTPDRIAEILDQRPD